MAKVRLFIESIGVSVLNHFEINKGPIFKKNISQMAAVTVLFFTIEIETRTGTLLAKVWLMRVGRVKLFLLDCDVEGNSPEDRELTSRLYGGDVRTRIRQELVLGVGGVRALRALGITPGVLHLNEGHSAFGPLEVIRLRMHDDGLSFDDAVREVASQTNRSIQSRCSPIR